VKEEISISYRQQYSLAEVQLALNNLKPKKATEPDNLSSDILKEGGTKLYLWLTILVNPESLQPSWKPRKS